MRCCLKFCTFQWWDIPAIEIAKATVQVAELRYKQGTSLRQYLAEKADAPPADLFSVAQPTSINDAIKVLEGLIKAVSNTNLQGIVEKVIREGGFLSHIMNAPDRPWLMQLLTGFFDHVKGETRRQPQLELEEFMGRIELMKREGLVLPLVQVAGNDKGVNLMTAHGSKGLEFDYVFFTGCASSCWEKKRKPFSGFSFPDTLFGSGTKDTDNEELRRLFYVALTRAKKHLYISYSNYTTEGKTLEASMFIAEIEAHHILPKHKIVLDAETVMDFNSLHFTDTTAPEVAHLDDELENRAVQSFVMNVSALNNYLKCPLQFYYQNIVRIPSPKNEAMEFGSAVHHALEHLFKKMQEAEQFPSADEFVADFTWYMRRHRESFTKESYARRLEYGQKILVEYYYQYIRSWNKIVTVERNLKNIPVDDIYLKGKIDKIEFRGKEATIVDYKTGDPEKSREKLQPPNEKAPNGGDYWRQAVFYKIMVDNYSAKDWNVAAVEFDFIEPDKKKEYRKEKIVVSPSDITTVKQQIETVWNKIQDRDFYTGCGKEDCHWCKFVKTNKLAVALHEMGEDEEDEVKTTMLKVVLP